MPITTPTPTRLGMSILLTATMVGSIEIAIGIAETLTGAILLVATLIAADTIVVTITDAKLLSNVLDSRPSVLSTGGLLLSGIADPGDWGKGKSAMEIELAPECPRVQLLPHKVTVTTERCVQVVIY
jgi:hypothetical protein